MRVPWSSTVACNLPPSLARLPLASVVTSPKEPDCAAVDVAEGMPAARTVLVAVPMAISLVRLVVAPWPMAVAPANVDFELLPKAHAPAAVPLAPEPSAQLSSPEAEALAPSAMPFLPLAEEPVPIAVLLAPLEANNSFGSRAARLPLPSEVTASVAPDWVALLAAVAKPPMV